MTEHEMQRLLGTLHKADVGLTEERPVSRPSGGSAVLPQAYPIRRRHQVTVKQEVGLGSLVRNRDYERGL